MPLYDYECQSCGHIRESIQPVAVGVIACEKCGCHANRIISCSGVNCANEDAGWIRSVTDILPKGEDATAADRRFAANPTRSNYKAWMESRGLRPLEPGERTIKPNPDREMAKIHREVWERHRKRKAIEI